MNLAKSTVSVGAVLSLGAALIGALAGVGTTAVLITLWISDWRSAIDVRLARIEENQKVAPSPREFVEMRERLSALEASRAIASTPHP